MLRKACVLGIRRTLVCHACGPWHKVGFSGTLLWHSGNCLHKSWLVHRPSEGTVTTVGLETQGEAVGRRWGWLSTFKMKCKQVHSVAHLMVLSKSSRVLWIGCPEGQS